MKYKDIYLIGICGVAMGTLACMLKEKGFRVSGSDQNMYPPMNRVLGNAGIEVFQGFSEVHISSPDCVIVGNAISRGNPELEFVLNNRIPYMSMAGALREFFLQHREVIAVCGTHGKTTTTALLAHILETSGFDPSFFVGGVVKNYNSNYQLKSGKYFIIEGDEYDSAFFEKVPKFMIYRPQHVVLTSLEFDHADIYSSLDEIEIWFKRLVNIIPANGTAIYNGQSDILTRIMKGARCRYSAYGGSDEDYNYEFKEFKHDRARVLFRGAKDAFEIDSQIFGDINYMNITAAVSMALECGVSPDDIQRSVASFQGVKRRQELLMSHENIRVYEDFAHHPTAIHGVLETMKKRFPDAVLWALYEPRSATSRRNVFQNELPGAFACASRVILKSPYNLEALPHDHRMDVAAVCNQIRQSGGNAIHMENADDIVHYVLDVIDPERENVIVIMSNGAFDGIYEKLIFRLKYLFCDKMAAMTTDN